MFQAWAVRGVLRLPAPCTRVRTPSDATNVSQVPPRALQARFRAGGARGGAELRAAREAGTRAELCLDAQQLVVLGDALGTSRRPGLDAALQDLRFRHEDVAADEQLQRRLVGCERRRKASANKAAPYGTIMNS